MSKVHDIPYEDVKEFLLANNANFKNEDEAYDLILNLLKAKKSIGHTTSIIEWMMAHNLLINKIDIPNYSSYDIDNMSQVEINELTKLLTMKGNNRNNIKNILRYLDKLQDDQGNDHYEIIFTRVKDVDVKILLDLNDYELNKICQTNKYINTLCNDDYFWKFKLDKLISMELFPTDLRNKGKEIYINFKKYFDEKKAHSCIPFTEEAKFIYIANWATVNNYPSVLDLLIKLKHFPGQSRVNMAALKGNIEVLNVLKNYIKKTSPSNHPAMLKYLSKDIFPNVKGANLANLNKQQEVLDLLKEFNIHPDHNYIDLKKYADDALKNKDDELLDELKSINIYPTLFKKLKI